MIQKRRRVWTLDKQHVFRNLIPILTPQQNHVRYGSVVENQAAHLVRSRQDMDGSYRDQYHNPSVSRSMNCHELHLARSGSRWTNYYQPNILDAICLGFPAAFHPSKPEVQTNGQLLGIQKPTEIMITRKTQKP